MKVEIWSDVVCPWCYIGKRRFETGLKRVAEHRSVDSIEVVYRPFMLDPTVAPGRAQPVAEVYAKKFGGPERAAAILERVTSVAAADGIEFRMDRALRANTLQAHRLLWYAESHGDQSALKERIMQAYFTDGHDVSDPDVLVQCAADTGFDPDHARRFLESDEGGDEVAELFAFAASNGITAVPTYVINEQWAIPGAQDVEVFERLINRLLDKEAVAADEAASV